MHVKYQSNNGHGMGTSKEVVLGINGGFDMLTKKN